MYRQEDKSVANGSEKQHIFKKATKICQPNPLHGRKKVPFVKDKNKRKNEGETGKEYKVNYVWQNH
jgi:hypothetical protein